MTRILSARRITVALLATTVLAAPAMAQQDKPNILFILADNLGYGEIGVYGGGATRGAPTPRIDRLAAEGFRLTNMNMETQCTPSRSAIMTGRSPMRSGTYAVPFGGVPEGLTQWEVTLAEALSGAGYTSAHFGKWHLGSEQGRYPTDQGFDEWFGIPRTTDEAMWPGSPGYDTTIMRPEHMMEGRKGERSRELGVYDTQQRRLIDAEITRRSVDFMERQVRARRPFFMYANLTQPHLPTLPNPAFRTGNGDWADMLAEMDHNVGTMLDALDRLGIRDNTIVIFTSDNGPEHIRPYDGWSGPWRGQYNTSWEGALRVPFIVRWPSRIAAGRVSNEIVHGLDLFPTLATIAGARVPTDRPMDGVDQSRFFLGATDSSARDGFIVWVGDRLQAVKWRNFKVHFYHQENMMTPPQRLHLMYMFNLFTNPMENENKTALDTWILGPVLGRVAEYEASTRRYPVIPMGTPDPYRAPAPRQGN